MYQVQKRISGKKMQRKSKFEKEPVLKNLPKVETTPHHWENSPVSSPTTAYEKENIKEFGSPKKGKVKEKKVKEKEKEKTPIKEKTPSPKKKTPPKEKTPTPKKEKRKSKTKKEKEIKGREENKEEKIDYSKLKVPELKAILREKGLKVGGNKAELIARLTGKEVVKEKEKGEKGRKENVNGNEYTKLKVPELKELLKGKGLRVSGNKTELINRLVAYDNEKEGNKGHEGDEGKGEEEREGKDELRKKYNKMTVVEIKKILSDKGLTRTGKKADLIERLVNTTL